MKPTQQPNDTSPMNMRLVKHAFLNKLVLTEIAGLFVNTIYP
jgi:hypothetical protein